MTGTKGAKKPEEMSYGEAAARLEEILRQIEEGEVDIDQLSELVREAAGLVSVCRKKIQAAEMQVQTITAELEREAAAEIGESAGLAEAEAPPGAEPT
jgi:exodeoxyribonuclease VII small subunit